MSGIQVVILGEAVDGRPLSVQVPAENVRRLTVHGIVKVCAIRLGWAGLGFQSVEIASGVVSYISTVADYNATITRTRCGRRCC